MACIIRMKSDEFLDKFIKNHDYRRFNFLLISENVQTEKKYKNVYPIPTLIPPPNIISEFVANGYTPKYVKKYLDYIQTPRVEAMITIMVKLAIVDNSNVILLCSKAEDEFKYINIICQYIEELYGVKTYTYKKYKKDPAKCEEVSEKTKKKVVKLLETKISEIQDIESPKINKKEALARLEKLSRKELTKFMNRHRIGYNPEASTKKLRKQIVEMMSAGIVEF